MKIGFCYDTREDYGFSADNLDYTDFVSFNTVSEIKNALERNGHDIFYIGNLPKLQEFLNSGKQVDIFFNIVEGFQSRNREAMVPCLLEIYNKPYTGSDAYVMEINLNKNDTKKLAKSIGIPVANSICMRHFDDSSRNYLQELSFPVIIKPNLEGGSMGLKIAEDIETAILIANQIADKYDQDVLIEEYISGKEITVPVIGTGIDAKALGVVAIEHEEGSDITLYDEELKYVDNVVNKIYDECDQDIRNKLMEYSEKIHRYFQMNDYSRMDFRLTEDNRIFFLEINAMPSLCRHGSFEVCGKEMGLEYHNVIQMILDSACKRNHL